jgi:hypothetical protein
MHIRATPLFALLLAGLPGMAQAQDEEGAGVAVHLTPFATFRAGGDFEDAITGKTRSVASHAGLAFALGLSPYASGQQYELFYSRQETNVGGTDPFDLDIEYLHFGGTFDYGDESEGLVPFVAGGFGATRMTPHSPGLDEETHWSVSLGGGVKVPLSKRVLARVELRGYYTFLHSNSDIFCVSINGSATCSIRVKGNGFFQGEALAGLSFKF